MLNLKKIHHIAIIASDYPKTREFYVDKLGFKIVSEVYREPRDSYKLDLEVGGQYQIEIFSFPSAPPRPSNPEACGLRHLAFEVDDINEVIKQLNDKEIETEPIRIDPSTGKQFTFFADPDGLPLELYEA